MTLKRKRSENALSPFSAPGSATASSRDASSSPSPDAIMFSSHRSTLDIGYQAHNGTSHLHSRTRKRYRDNRPDEGTIHENTYQMLFAAARSPPAEPAAALRAVIHERPEPPQCQPSLHNFWSLPSSAPSIANNAPSIPLPMLACQDCDVMFPIADADTCMGGMDDDSFEAREYGCRECRRIVCDKCAVVDVGIGRECLDCRTSLRKKWVGGIGWMV